MVRRLALGNPRVRFSLATDIGSGFDWPACGPGDEGLAERLREPRVRRVIEPILAGGSIGDVPLDDIRFVVDLGLDDARLVIFDRVFESDDLHAGIVDAIPKAGPKCPGTADPRSGAECQWRGDGDGRTNAAHHFGSRLPVPGLPVIGR